VSGDDTKVVFIELNQVRALRGRLVAEDSKFVTLERRDGRVRIAKSCVVKIQQKSSSIEED
jgi:hypothetical protein